MPEETQADPDADRDSDESPATSTGKAGGKAGKRSFTRYLIGACVAFLVIGVGSWLFIVIPEYFGNGEEEVEEVTAAMMEEERAAKAKEMAAERLRKTKEAEASATWRSFHCNLIHRYFVGSEVEIPVAELLGLAPGSDEEAIGQRCRELLPAVRQMGGWPNAKPQQDNYIVCDGFRFTMKQGGNLTITPTRDGLAKGEVDYGVPDRWTRTMKLADGMAWRLPGFVPLVTQADDRCIVVGLARSRGTSVAGTITRVKAEPPREEPQAEPEATGQKPSGH